MERDPRVRDVTSETSWVGRRRVQTSPRRGKKTEIKDLSIGAPVSVGTVT